MLTLPIKKKWFDMILSGEKKEEYREIKEYYETRFQNLFIEDYSASDTTPDNMRIEAARINAVTLAEELEHLKAL